MHFKVAAEDKTNHRYSGVLVHPTSFPSPYGIGDMGRGAHEFIDFLAMAGQHLWQVLPLGPSGNGNSPYQSYSVFAGQTLLISPELLIEKKLLTEADVHPIPEFNADRVDYDKVTTYKTSLFKKAYEHFRHTADKNLLEEYDSFQSNNQYWLDDYCLYMAGKDYHNGLPWYEWEDSLLDPTPKERASWMKLLASEIDYYRFIQFAFFSQWYELKDYANKKGIAIIGDIPIFTAPDSADVWANKELFKLDSKGYPLEVAGVPPDYFSATGQLWGNPLYDYEAMKHDGFGWWIRRIDGAARLYDVVRIDHFRGFAAYWAVPHGETTARNGHWMPGPGMDLVGVLTGWFPNLSFIAEDLGTPAPEVTALLSVSGLPGMRVLEFAFDNPQGQSPYLPHRCIENCVYYTGTHDNAPLSPWRSEVEPEALTFAAQYLGLNPQEGFCAGMLRGGMMTSAKLFVSQLQDWLEAEDVGRINTPGTAQGNWQFRLSPGVLSDELAAHIRAVTARYGRLPDCAALKAASSQPMPHL